MSAPQCVLTALLASMLCLAACSSGRGVPPNDPTARAGTGSEEIWYRYGGARTAYTAVSRPRILDTGYAAVHDPALYQAPQAKQTQRGAPVKKRAAKAPAKPLRDPDCPPCPPAADAAAAVPSGGRSSPSSPPAPGAAAAPSPVPPPAPPVPAPKAPPPAAPPAPGTPGA